MSYGEISEEEEENTHYNKIKNVIKPKFLNDIPTTFNSTDKKSINCSFSSKKNSKPVEYMTLNDFKFAHKHFEDQKWRATMKGKTIKIGQTQICGEWKTGKLSGYCYIRYSEGHTFEGRCEYGFRIQGIMKFPDGAQYEGKFCEDQFHGPAIITDPYKRKIFCNWFKGTPGNRGRIQYQSGDIYLGEIKNFKKHGRGTVHFKNGEKLIAYFQEGTINGLAEMYRHGTKIFERIYNHNSISQNQKHCSIFEPNIYESSNLQLKQSLTKN